MALSDAILQGDLQTFQQLLASGADVNAAGLAGFRTLGDGTQTPLHFAALNTSKQAVTMVELLLAQGADVHVKNIFCETPLHFAADNISEHAVKMVELLLAQGAHVHVKNISCETPLHFAAKNTGEHAAKLVELLLAQGADVHAKTEYGKTPLHFAADNASEQAVKMVELLLAHGADVHVKANDDEERIFGAETPLQVAVRNRSEHAAKLVELLLAQGADVHVKANDGRTPLHFAADNTSEHAVKMVELLLAHGADVHAKANDDEERGFGAETPLQVAVRNISEHAAKLVELLLAQGADVHVKARHGQVREVTPLHLAVLNKSGHAVTIVELLLAQGADVHAKTEYGETPLRAVARNPVKMVELLLAHGADASDSNCSFPATASSSDTSAAGVAVHEAIIRIRDDASCSAAVQLRQQAAQGKVLLSELGTSQCRLRSAMSALRTGPCTPGGVAERDTAFQLQAECAGRLMDFIKAGTDDQEEVPQHVQQCVPAECGDTFDTTDVQQVDCVLEAASTAHRAACEAVEAYGACTERMATAVRTAATVAELGQASDAMRAAAAEVVAAEGRLQGCRDRALVAGSALLATLASVRGKRALCESILQEAEKRPDKAALVPDMDALRVALRRDQKELVVASHKHEIAKTFDGAEEEEMEELAGRVTAARRQVCEQQKLLEQQERRVAEAALHYYPELDVGKEVREWGGLLCKRARDSYTDRVDLSAAACNHIVHKATRGDGTLCVLKQFKPEHSGRLLCEARVLQRLCHPCVAEVTCVFQTTDPVGWAMEMPYYSGGDLAQHMQRIRKLGMAAVCRVVRDVAQGLAFVHRSGVVHCDVKPANVFLEEDGRARLGDFDISKDVGRRAADTATRTRMTTLRVQGTPGYMAPEVEVLGKACFASDVYSLGLVFYDLVVSGDHPRTACVQGGVQAAPPVRGRVPEQAEALLVRMLCEDAAGRPTAEEVVLDPLLHNVHNSDLSQRLEPPVHWHDPSACGVLVDVTRELRSVMQSQVNGTCTVAELGKGRDNSGTDHKGLEVEGVWRVEHATLWKEYQFRRDQMQQHGPQKGVAVQPLCTLSEGLGTDPLSQQLNEVRLFHGTQREVADIVVSQGMDERVCTWGLHGAGLYFAENSSKSDEYMVPAAGDGLCDLLVCRVLLGTPSVQTSTDRTRTVRRPPCVEGHRPCTAGHPMADSIVAEVPHVPREFVVFDRTSVYPEYVLRVRRVGVENPQCA